MGIEYHILGTIGRDNAVFVRITTGQAIYRLLFDCGDECLPALERSELQTIDHLLFSHLHMDHIAGFDGLFRLSYNDPTRPHMIWGPPASSQIMQHRFRGFLWNLHEGQAGTWLVADINETYTELWRFELAEAFADAHPAGRSIHHGPIIDTNSFSVEALMMDHQTPSIAYIVREKARINIDSLKLAALGLKPGPWLQQLKTSSQLASSITIDGTSYDTTALAAELLIETPGKSLAYLTDFILDEPAKQRLLPALAGCTTMICESQYCEADRALALRNHHMTSSQAAQLAHSAGVEQLVLFHFSERYRGQGWQHLLQEAQAIFPNTLVPEHWDLRAK